MLEYRLNKMIVWIGVAWTLVFAGMSFYWALGGMIGVRSLGGAIYEQALNPEPSFVIVVWVTAFVKLLGAVILLALFVRWQHNWARKGLYWIIKIAGIFLFLYGLLNFITIGMHAVGIISYQLDTYATWWRLLFWEPFWMLGGVLYYFSVKK